MSEAAFKLSKTDETQIITDVFRQQLANQFTIGKTSVRERVEKLQRLHDCVLKYRKEIYAALWADFQKNETEVDISEIGVVVGEIRHTIQHLASWMAPKEVRTPIALIGTSSEIIYDSKGVCLLISPWNFPFNLTFGPLASAIAAGNCVIIKPSELTPHSSALMGKMIKECFQPNEVCLFEGDASVAQALLQLPFHHIFFTGSPAIGKVVMRAAAEHLSSVTLELGGKSPVIVDGSTRLSDTAAQITWLKCLNTGQICIAPDYVLVHESAKDILVQKMKEKIQTFYGDSPEARQATKDYPRMVNDRHFQRVKRLLDQALEMGAELAFGGHTDAADRYIEPTILCQVPEQADIWQEEIFGPVLLVKSYKNLEDVIQEVNSRPRPLSMYLHSSHRKTIDYILQSTRCGNVTVNDCGLQFYNINLPFGGVNNSGIGRSHGYAGFLAFSNERAVVRQNRIWPHTRFFYPPYAKKLTRLMREGIVKWF
jgi:aldehyde dehydrogenase (NAD+)